eukprot:768203-Hanusia_phi.AAC.9
MSSRSHLSGLSSSSPRPRPPRYAWLVPPGSNRWVNQGMRASHSPPGPETENLLELSEFLLLSLMP